MASNAFENWKSAAQQHAILWFRHISAFSPKSELKLGTIVKTINHPVESVISNRQIIPIKTASQKKPKCTREDIVPQGMLLNSMLLNYAITFCLAINQVVKGTGGVTTETRMLITLN